MTRQLNSLRPSAAWLGVALPLMLLLCLGYYPVLRTLSVFLGTAFEGSILPKVSESSAVPSWWQLLLNCACYMLAAVGIMALTLWCAALYADKRHGSRLIAVLGILLLSSNALGSCLIGEILVYRAEGTLQQLPGIFEGPGPHALLKDNLALACIWAWRFLGLDLLAVGALMSVLPYERYAALKLEGAPLTQLFLQITWPGLKTAVGLLLLWECGEALLVFEAPRVLAAEVAEAQTPLSALFAAAFEQGAAASAAALGVVLLCAVPVALLSRFILERGFWHERA